MPRATLPRPAAGKALLTLVHAGGTRRAVTYLGVSGSPLQAQVAWPLAGSYAVNLKTGRLIGSEKTRAWKLDGPELRAVRRAHRDAHQRTKGRKR